MAARREIGEAANDTGGNLHVGIFKWRGRVSRKDFDKDSWALEARLIVERSK
jgi:hypothetical protein